MKKKEAKKEISGESTVDEILDKYTESGLVSEAIDAVIEKGMDVNAVIEEMKDQLSALCSD